MLDLPDWYDTDNPTYEDIEAIVCDLFEWIAPEITTVTWLPDDWYEAPYPILVVHRAAGRTDGDFPHDYATVQVAAQARTRQEAWELLTFVRVIMQGVSGGFMVPRSFFKENGERVRTQVMSVEEWAGPIQGADDFVDDRRVTANYRVLVRENRFRSPDYYRQIMQNLPY
jgi:hypothetical protein